MKRSTNKAKLTLVGGGALAVLSLAWVVLAPEEAPSPARPSLVHAARASAVPPSDGFGGARQVSRSADAPPAQPRAAERASPGTRPALERRSLDALDRAAGPPPTVSADDRRAASQHARQRRRSTRGIEAATTPRRPGERLAAKSPQTQTRIEETENGPVITALRHLATFSPEGLTFLPRDGEGRPVSRGRFSYRLEAVERDDLRVYDAAAEGPGTLRADGHEVRYQRNALVRERYVARDAGVEQQFDVAEIPAGEGDLVVRGRVETPLAGEAEEDGGLLFAAGGEALVRFGHAVAFDATGRQTAAPIHYAAGVLEIRVPGAWLAEAEGPLLIDPLIGSAMNVTNFVADDFNASVAYNSLANEYLLVFTNGNNNLTVSRLEPDGDEIVGGVILDANGSKALTAVS